MCDVNRHCRDQRRVNEPYYKKNEDQLLLYTKSTVISWPRENSTRICTIVYYTLQSQCDIGSYKYIIILITRQIYVLFFNIYYRLIDDVYLIGSNNMTHFSVQYLRSNQI